MLFEFKKKPKVDKTEWHDFFCLTPRFIEDDHAWYLVWLKTVERRVSYTRIGRVDYYRIKKLLTITD